MSTTDNAVRLWQMYQDFESAIGEAASEESKLYRI